ncbi:ABC-2 transporter permease [Alkalihalobacterium elongatum]|uniref:ABC-2 transporter permease n=1 Tax=Alkalihalobacterium elongatum TaxID=2675466 RepID=UPI001C1FF0F9|nr:ABC-2 transporter permease [Alkalihalobacterium elongatum]
MQSLIKKDLLSLKNISMIFIPITIFFQLFITWYISSMGGFQYNDLSGIIFFIVLFNTLMSYGLVTHICNTEKLSGVDKRMWQLPIPIKVIVLAKFSSALIIVLSINAVTFGTLFFVQTILGHSVGIGYTGGAVLLMNALILLFISSYLFFYFTYDAQVANWVGRIFIVGAIFIPMFISWPTSRIFGRPIQTIEPLLNQFFFISTLLLLVFAIAFSIRSYDNFYKMNKKFQMTGAFLSTFVLLMTAVVGSAVALSSPPLNTKEEIIEHISVESIELRYEQENINGTKFYGVRYQVVLSGSHLSDPKLLHDLGVSIVIPEDDPLYRFFGPDFGVDYGGWSYHRSRPTFTSFGSVGSDDINEEQLRLAIGESRPQIAIYENFQEKAPARLINY